VLKKAINSSKNQNMPKPSNNERKPGAWKGKVTIEKDFDALPFDFVKYFK